MRNILRIIRIVALIVVFGLLLNAAEYLDLDNLMSRDGLAQLVAMMQSWGSAWGVLGAFAIILFATFTVLINIPTVIVLAAVAIVYNPMITFLIGITYWALSCFLLYLIGHNLGQKLVSSMLEALPKKAHQLFAHNGFRTILYMRLAMFAFPPTNWVLAALPVTAREYITASVLGGIPHIIVWSTLGPRVIDKFISGEAGWWYSPEILFISTYGLIMPVIVSFFMPAEKQPSEAASDN